MNIASIDIGSNTVLLLIAKVNLQESTLSPIINLYQAPRISKGIDEKKLITNEKVYRLLKVLSIYNEKIKYYNCVEVLITATYALRIAANSNDILEKIKKKFNWNVKIISGNEEARLSYLGAGFPSTENESKTIIDIGGGSTEIINGTGGSIHFNKSFNIGVVTLTERFINNYPVTLNTIIAIEKELKKIFNDLIGKIDVHSKTIAVAGTPTTLSCIRQRIKDYDDEKVEGSILYKSDIVTMVNTLKEMDPLEVANNFGQVTIGREDVLLSGTLILKVIVELLEIDSVVVSGKGIRYGTIVDYMLNQKKGT